MNPLNTVLDAKRLIGRRFSDKQQSDINTFSYKVVGKEDELQIQVNYKKEEKISTRRIYGINKNERDIEAYFGKTVKNAVVTV